MLEVILGLAATAWLVVVLLEPVLARRRARSLAQDVAKLEGRLAQVLQAAGGPHDALQLEQRIQQLDQRLHALELHERLRGLEAAGVHPAPVQSPARGAVFDQRVELQETVVPRHEGTHVDDEVHTPRQVMPVTVAPSPVQIPATPDARHVPRVESPVPDDFEQGAWGSGHGTAGKAQPAPHRLAVSEQFRRRFGREGWEAVVGGSWLNKAGMFVLVIGIALFLGYSFTFLQPSGRVAVGLAVSVIILLTGVRLEGRADYVTFGRVLVGGGWAALYFTTYAMGNVDASRVVHDEVLAMLLLCASSAGMIAHSLRYRAEVVTGVGFLCAFAAIVVSEPSRGSIVATVPLSAALVFVAQRFAWTRLLLLGLAGTYGTILFMLGRSSPQDAQLALALHWLIFEAADLLDVARRRRALSDVRAILPMNACGFVGVSLFLGTVTTPIAVSELLAVTGAAYVGSAVLRAWIRPPASFGGESSAYHRALGGGYEGAATLATALLTLSLHLAGLDEDHLTIALLLEAELLVLTGMYLRESFLRLLAAIVFAFPLLHLVEALSGPGVANHARTVVDAASTIVWPTLALLTAAVFYANRLLALRVPNRRPPEIAYAFVGTVLTLLVARHELPAGILGVTFLLLAVAYYRVGLVNELQEFRAHAAIAAGVGYLVTLFMNLLAPQALVGTGIDPWITLLPVAAVFYGFAAWSRGLSHQYRITDVEQAITWSCCTWAGSSLSAGFLWLCVPMDALAVAWWLLAAVVFELSLRGQLASLRMQSHVIAGAALLVALHVAFLGPSSPLGNVMLAAAVSAACATAARAYGLPRARIPEAERTRLRDASSIAATVLALFLAWHALPSAAVAVAWAVVGLLLFELGRPRLPELAVLCSQSAVVMALVFARLFVANFTVSGDSLLLSIRASTVLPIVALFYYLHWRARLADDQETRPAYEAQLASMYSYAAAILLVALVRFEAGRVLAVAGWAILCVVLTIAGIRFHDRDFRRQGYIIALLSVLRCWSTNFYVPESLSGGFDQVIAGGLVTACLLACQAMSPAQRPAEDGESTSRFRRLMNAIDAHPRATFSLLSTIILATLLFYQASGPWLTVAWALQGTALLSAGIFVHERVMRWGGLVLFATCIVKLFAWDFRELDTLPRIMSFITLGLLLLGVSWLYTRYREQLRSYL